MGVGGDDSWTPSVHSKYLLPPTQYKYSVRLSPIRAKDKADPPEIVARSLPKEGKTV
jgi:hypothetical protein